MRTNHSELKKKLQDIFGKKVVFDYPLSLLTTVHIGGPASSIIHAKNKNDITNAIAVASTHHIPYKIIGGASNIIPNDKGFSGMIIKNEITALSIDHSKKTCTVGAGHNLLSLIHKLNRNGLMGMEKMAGIPGTIGGALYGCAGAYGQEIKDCLRNILIFNGKKTRILTREKCGFGYRDSIFKKKKHWIILEASFSHARGDPKALQKTSREIITLRAKKYEPGLLCPGSFFKNIVIKHIKPLALQKEFIKKIDPQKIKFGKLASGYLLEEVGAKGLKQNGIAVAEHHGNLIYNRGNGTAKDLKHLVKLLKGRVHKKFGITLEEEVQYI